MSGTQSGGAVEPIAARLAAWRAIHASLPPNTFFVYRPNLKAEGLAIMTSRDFLSLVEAMQQLLGRAGVRGLAALAQQQQDSVVGQLAATVLRGDRLHYAEGFVVPVCCTCGKADGGHLLRCAKCRTAGYCSKECQRRQWGAHKKVCAHMAAEMEGVSRSAQRAQHAGQQQQATDEQQQAASAPAGPADIAATAAGQQASMAAAEGKLAAAASTDSAAAPAEWAWTSNPAARRLLLGGGTVLVTAAAVALAVGWWRCSSWRLPQSRSS